MYALAGSPCWIHNCTISVGDDHVAGHANDTLVEDCVFGFGHGVSIGSVSDGFIRNFTARRLSVTGAVQAFRIKTDQGGAGYVRDVLYDSATLSGVGTSIVVTMYYATSNATTTMAISNVTFSNIAAVDSGAAGSFECVPESPCRNMQLVNVQHTGSTPKGWQCKNAHGTAVDTSPDASSCLQA